jgi:hypothetical protein
LVSTGAYLLQTAGARKNSGFKKTTPSIPNYKLFKELGESKYLKIDQIYMIR